MNAPAEKSEHLAATHAAAAPVRALAGVGGKVRSLDSKPRLKWTMGRWWCYGGYVTGFDATPIGAYDAWLNIAIRQALK